MIIPDVYYYFRCVIIFQMCVTVPDMYSYSRSVIIFQIHINNPDVCYYLRCVLFVWVVHLCWRWVSEAPSLRLLGREVEPADTAASASPSLSPVSYKQHSDGSASPKSSVAITSSKYTERIPQTSSPLHRLHPLHHGSSEKKQTIRLYKLC